MKRSGLTPTAARRRRFFKLDMTKYLDDGLGPSESIVTIKASTNLDDASWLPMSTNTLTAGSSYFSDPN
jgi:hypothetical protein